MNYFRYLDNGAYRRWVDKFDSLSKQQAAAVETAMRARPDTQRIAVMPLYDLAGTKDLARFAAALKDQIFANWHIWRPADFDKANEHPHAAVSGTTWAEMLQAVAATADFVLPLPLDARLPRHALAHFSLVLGKEPDAAIVYGDEDRLLRSGRSHPRFKTDFDPFLMLGRDLIGVPALYRSSDILALAAGAFISTTEDNFLYELALKISVRTKAHRIVHIPAILCHRSQPPAWKAGEGRKAVQAHLTERGITGADIHPAPRAPQWNRIVFPLPVQPPLVSVIVPTRDRPELIGSCLDGLLTRTDYPSIEILIADNGTIEPEAIRVLDKARADPRVRVIRDEQEFNYSRLNNLAAAQARGDVVVLLNNDTKVIHADWLTELVSLVLQPQIGIAGAKLLNAESRIQHAGLVYGPDSTLTHQLCLLGDSESGPEGELALLRQVSAVTGACLVLRRDLYLELGGLNEAAFRIAYNDIDLCMRVAQRGLAIVWTPHASLLHHGCESRGPTNRPGPADYEFSENMRFWQAHSERYESPDPFHNPQITFFYEHVELAQPPRTHPLRLENLVGSRSPAPAFY